MGLRVIIGHTIRQTYKRFILYVLKLYNIIDAL